MSDHVGLIRGGSNRRFIRMLLSALIGNIWVKPGDVIEIFDPAAGPLINPYTGKDMRSDPQCPFVTPEKAMYFVTGSDGVRFNYVRDSLGRIEMHEGKPIMRRMAEYCSGPATVDLSQGLRPPWVQKATDPKPAMAEKAVAQPQRGGAKP